MISSIYYSWLFDTNAPFEPKIGSGIKKQSLFISLSSALVLSAFTGSNAYATEKPKICGCKDAENTLLKEGFKEIQSTSCKAPYQFKAIKSDCAYTVKVSADCKWTAVSSCSNTSVGTVGGQ